MLLCSLPAYVLIDSGSSHSFISLKFSMKLPIQPEPLGFELLVSQPMSRGTICTTVHRYCDLRFGDVCFSVDLIALEMSHFDVILDMDWLSANHVSINCAHKSVIIKSSDREFCFKGMGVISPPYLVSVAQARRLLKNGCQGFLCSVLSTPAGELKLSDILVVRGSRMSF